MFSISIKWVNFSFGLSKKQFFNFHSSKILNYYFLFVALMHVMFTDHLLRKRGSHAIIFNEQDMPMEKMEM